MRRIHSYNLALLFYFLQGKTLSIPYIDKRIPKETLDSMVDNLEDIANSSKHPLFNKEVQNGLYIVSLEEPQKHILKDYLEKYCTELVNDRLETRNQNVYNWGYARQEFIKRLAPLNLNCFISTNIYDMPQLAPELIKLHSNGGYSLEIEIKPVTNHISVESFNFKCSLNLSGIVEEHKKTNASVIREKKEQKRKAFSRQQQKLYNFLKRRAKDGQREFAKYDLRELVPLGNNALNSALNRLNKQHQEIHNTDKKLIEFNRGKGKFILNNEWNFDT